MPFVLLAVAGSLAAQGSQPLEYHQETTGSMTVHTPDGLIEFKNEFEARVSIVEVGPDSLHAWFDSLSVATIDPNGERRPDTGPVLGELYVLRRDARRRLETLHSPEAPPTFEGVTDLRAQFFDFFPSAPPGGYRVGATWTDTLVAPPALEPDSKSEMTKVIEFRVDELGDKDGVPVFVIRGDARAEWYLDAPFPNQPGIRAVTTMTGVEASVFYVAQDDGRLLERSRDASMEGQLEYVGAPQPTIFEMSRTNESVLRLVEGGAGG